MDIHTHYDGQVTWDPELAPSAWHDVTTVVQGNCGVCFAPVRPGREEEFISQMEGVEDIPGSALSEAMTWGWESFGDYLDLLDTRRWTIDVGTQIPHAAVRSYVMGDRAADPDANDDDIRRMTEIVRAGIKSGALGFSTSRILSYVISKGGVLPGTFAAIDELESIAAAPRLQPGADAYRNRSLEALSRSRGRVERARRRYPPGRLQQTDRHSERAANRSERLFTASHL